MIKKFILLIVVFLVLISSAYATGEILASDTGDISVNGTITTEGLDLGGAGYTYFDVGDTFSYETAAAYSGGTLGIYVVGADTGTSVRMTDLLPIIPVGSLRYWFKLVDYASDSRNAVAMSTSTGELAYPNGIFIGKYTSEDYFGGYNYMASSAYESTLALDNEWHYFIHTWNSTTFTIYETDTNSPIYSYAGDFSNQYTHVSYGRASADAMYIDDVYVCNGTIDCSPPPPPDTTPPTWDENPINFTLEYKVDSLFYRFNATDGTAVDDYFINDTVNFKINKDTGIFENNTILDMGFYVLNISVNDTSNNILSSLFWVVVNDTIPPLWYNNDTNFSSETSLGDVVRFNITVTELNPANYVFQFGNGTDYVNETGTYADGVPIIINKTINTNYPNNISVTWFFNDTTGNDNNTDTYIYELSQLYSHIDLLFANDTDTAAYKTIFNEGEDFFTYINWTDENGAAITNTSGTCNITVFKGLLEEKAADENFTLCTSGCDYPIYSENFTFHSTNITDEVIEDTIMFDICTQHIVRDLILTARCDAGTNVMTIPKENIPLCSSGTAPIVQNFTTCITNSTINLTLSNIATSANRHTISNLEMDREYAAHLNKYPNDVFYNSTIDLWQTNHAHEYYEGGFKSIFGNCSNIKSQRSNSTNETIFIVTPFPTIFIEGFELPNGSFVEFIDDITIDYLNGTYILNSLVISEELSTIQYYLRNSTNILFNVNSSTSIFINISSALLRDLDYNPFNITIIANNTAGNITVSSLLFNITDIQAPTLTFINPLGDNSSVFYINTSSDFSLLAEDESLYSFELNLTCDGVLRFNYTNTSLTGLTTFNFNQTIDFTGYSEGTCNINARVCDGHTGKKIDEWNIKQDKEKITYNDEVTVTANMPYLDEFETEFEEDRYKFKIKLEDNTTDYLEFTINSKHYIDILDTEYLGHLVTGMYWIDFSNSLVDYVEIERINETEVLVKIYLTEKVSEITFNSIGILNCYEQTVVIELREVLFEFTFKRYECDMTTTPKAIGLSAMILFITAIWMFALWTKIPILNIIVGLVVCFFAWQVAACFFFANVLYIFMGIVSILFGIKFSTDNFYGRL